VANPQGIHSSCGEQPLGSVGAHTILVFLNGQSGGLGGVNFRAYVAFAVGIGILNGKQQLLI
jgi:hypothetical protein